MKWASHSHHVSALISYGNALPLPLPWSPALFANPDALEYHMQTSHVARKRRFFEVCLLFTFDMIL